MKQILLAGLGLIVFLSSCQKEKEEKPSVVGYWTGGVSQGFMHLLNKQDGKAVIYLFVSQPQDTTAPLVRAIGDWHLNGNQYTANFSTDDTSGIKLAANVGVPTIVIDGVLTLYSGQVYGGDAFAVAKKQ